MSIFDGRKIRDEILIGLKNKVATFGHVPKLAAFWIGSDPVCGKYIELKQKFADKIGVQVEVSHSEDNISEEEIVNYIERLNNDSSIDGIMIQMPVPADYDRNRLVHKISPLKDIDGLRFCSGFDSEFRPPVVLAVLKAIEESKKDLKNSKVVIVGKGFLVGTPLARCLEERTNSLIIADKDTKDLREITKKADILISATGKAGLIKPDMIKEGLVLIDAGTAEVDGDILGDIDLGCYSKACFYTPVPGGIGPMTVAMLLKNLVDSTSRVK
jgi:methylenetetrahydrofolate dehydrogenase (NADP+)/methenyltetrahydrofolate cyclohydrolase